MYGQMFIYKNQIYSMGVGGDTQAGLPYGNNNVEERHTPKVVPVAGTVPTGWTKVWGTYHNACALSNVGTVYCIGDNDAGQLGVGDTTDRYQLTQVTFPSNAAPITDIIGAAQFRDNTAANDYSMWHALDSNGKVWGWGYNGNSELGDGTGVNRTTPVAIGTAGFQALTITKLWQSGYTGQSTTRQMAALTNTGDLYVWGYQDANGGLGLGDSTSRSVPTFATSSVVDVGMEGMYNGVSHQFATVIVKSNGEVWATGDNAQGVLGDNTQTDRLGWVKSQGLPSNVSKVYVTAGNGDGGTAYAVTSDGYVYSVGYNGYGNLGVGDTAIRTTYQLPVGDFQGKVAKVVTFGAPNSTSHTYILTTDGQLYYAGYNGVGGAGTGDYTAKTTFTRTALNTNGAKVVDVRYVGFTSNSGVTITLDNGTMMSAGQNTYGQLGLDTLDTTHQSYANFEYVIGFGVNERGSALTGNSTIPFNFSLNTLIGMTSSTTLDNLANTLTWAWSTLTNQTGWKVTANSLTTGTVMEITSSSTALNSTYGLFSVRDLGTTTAGTLASFISSTTASTNGGLWIKNNGTVGIGTSSPSAMLDLRNGSSTLLALNVNGGAVAFSSGSTFASSTRYTNDVNLGNASVIRVSATSSNFFGITGIADLFGTSTAHVDGRLLTLINASSTASFTIYNQSASSTAANRIITGTGQDLTVAADASINLVYDGTTARWRVVGGSGGGTSNTVQSVIASTTIAAWNKTIVASTAAGSVVITLPTAVSNSGSSIEIVKTTSDANSVVILPASGQTINGLPNLILANTNDSVVLRSDGVNVVIVSDNRSSIGTAGGSLVRVSLDPQLSGSFAAGTVTGTIPNTSYSTERILWNKIISQSGNDITFNATNTAVNMSTAGYFTLKAGKTYKIAYQYNLFYSDIAGTTYQQFGIYNVTSGTMLAQDISRSQGAIAGDMWAANHQRHEGSTIITPNVDTIITVQQPGGWGTWNSYWNSAATGGVVPNSVLANDNWMEIEVISGAPSVTQTADYVDIKTADGTGFTNNSYVDFASVVSGNMSVDTSAETITLMAGKTYHMTAMIRGYGGSASLEYGFVDATSGNELVANTGRGILQGNSSAEHPFMQAELVYTATTTQTIKVRGVGGGIGTFNYEARLSRIYVEQIGGSAYTGGSVLYVGSNFFTKSSGLTNSGNIIFDGANTATSTPGMFFYTANNKNFGLNATTSGLQFWVNNFEGSTTPAMILNNQGHLSIGSGTSGSNLTVQGDTAGVAAATFKMIGAGGSDIGIRV
jgi:alpha-tubulin suppressor-like RCC1 family protein